MPSNAPLTEVQPLPIEDRPYGKLEGHVRDPLSHMWILGSLTEALLGEETRKQMALSKLEKERQS